MVFSQNRGTTAFVAEQSADIPSSGVPRGFLPGQSSAASGAEQTVVIPAGGGPHGSLPGQVSTASPGPVHVDEHLPDSVEWVQLRDEATSKPYFWNRRTRADEVEAAAGHPSRLGPPHRGEGLGIPSPGCHLWQTCSVSGCCLRRTLWVLCLVASVSCVFGAFGLLFHTFRVKVDSDPEVVSRTDQVFSMSPSYAAVTVPVSVPREVYRTPLFYWEMTSGIGVCWLMTGPDARQSWPVWTCMTVAVACTRLVFFVTMYLALCSFVVFQALMRCIMVGMDQQEQLWRRVQKLLKIPQLLFIMVVVFPVITQRQIPMVLVTKEILLLLDKVVDVPCCAGRAASWVVVQTCRKTVVPTVAVPVSSFDMPVVCARQVLEVSQVQFPARCGRRCGAAATSSSCRS